MSGDYASRLKEYHHKGVCGLPESTESTRSLKLKAEQLARLVTNARRIVVLTGAGISTAAGIPDFRGPQGKRQTNESAWDGTMIVGICFWRVTRAVVAVTI